VDEQLGVWISECDKFMIVFFDDNTFLLIRSSLSTEFGRWERKEDQKDVLAIFSPGYEHPGYVTLKDDKLIWHNGDYDVSSYCRLLQGRKGTNLKVTVIDLDKPVVEPQ